MTSCSIKRNDKGLVTEVLAPNGIPSKAFEKVNSIPFLGTSETSLKIVSNLYSDKVKKMYSKEESNRYTYSDTNEPVIFLKDKNGKIWSDIESPIIENVLGDFEVGILNPEDSSFIKLSSFNTNSSSQSQIITNGIAEGLVSSKRIINKDGELVFEGKGYDIAQRRLSSAIFKDDYSNIDITPIKRFEDGTFKFLEIPDLIILDKYDSQEIVSPKELKDVVLDNGIKNRAEVLFQITDWISKPFKSLVKRSSVSEKTYISILDNFLESLGINKMTMDEYKKQFKNRHGQDVDVSALTDLANKVVAIGENNVIENMTEEVAHLAVETYADQESILGALSEVHLTDEYRQYANIYREKYKHQYKNNDELEDAVRKEILGKIIAKGVRDNAFSTDGSKSIWERFVAMIKSLITKSHKTKIQELTKQISNDILNSNNVFTTPIKTDGGIFYALVDLNSDIKRGLEVAENAINGLADAMVREGKTGKKVNLRIVGNSMEDYEFVNNVNKVVDSLLQDTKGLIGTLSQGKAAPVDYVRVNVLKTLLSNNINKNIDVLTELKTKLQQEFNSLSLSGKSRSKESSMNKELINVINGVESKIKLLNQEFSKVENEYRNLNINNFNEIVNEMIDIHGLTKKEADDLLSLFNGNQKDLSKLFATWGVSSESSNPYISLMSAISSKLLVRHNNKTQNIVTRFLNLAKTKNWLRSEVQESILEKNKDGTLTGNTISGVNMGAYQKAKDDEAIRLIKSISKKTLTDKEVEVLYKTRLPEDIFDNKSDVELFENGMELFYEQNRERVFVDSYYEEKEQLFKDANVSEYTKEEMQGERSTIRQIQSKYRDENGKIDQSKMTELDKELYDYEMQSLKSKASPIGKDLDVLYGLKIVRVSDLTNKDKSMLPYFNDPLKKESFSKALGTEQSVVVLPNVPLEDLSPQARYSLDQFNMNFARRVKFSESSSTKSYDDFASKLAELEAKGDYAGAFTFAKMNGAVTFTDEYYDAMSGMEGIVSVAKENIDDLDDSAVILIEEIERLSLLRSQFLKSYRSSTDVMQINAEHISKEERDNFALLEENIQQAHTELKLLLKSSDIEFDYNGSGIETITLHNNSFLKDMEASGMSVKEFVDSVITEKNRNDLRSFSKWAISQFGNSPRKSKMYDSFIDEIENSLEYKEALMKPTDNEKIEALTLLYSFKKLPSYYKANTPQEWGKISDDIIKGNVLLSEIVKNNKTISKYVTINPNFNWVDVQDQSSILNPHYKEVLGYDQPKFNKYKNKDFFSFFGLTEDDWLNNDDISTMVATREKDKFEYYQAMIELKKKSDGLYGYKGNLYQAIQKTTTTMQKIKQSTKKGVVKSGLKDVMSDIIFDRVDEAEYGETLDVGGLVKVPPVLFRKRVPDSNSITRDTFEAYLMDYVEAEKYSSRQEMTPYFHAILEKAKNTSFIDSSILRGKKKISKSGEVSETVRRLEDQMDYMLYGVKNTRKMEIDIFGKTIDLTRILNKARNLSVFTNLGFNPIVAATSGATGIINNKINRISGDIYSSIAIKEANKYKLKDSAEMVLTDGKLNPQSRLNTLLEAFGMKGVSNRFNESSSTRLGRLATESAYKLDELMNIPVQVASLYNTLFDHRLVEFTDSDGNVKKKFLSYSQFKKVKSSNGITSNYLLTAEWTKSKPFFKMIDTSNNEVNPTQEYLDMFSEEDFRKYIEYIGGKAQKENQKIDGVITEADKTMAQRDPLMAMIMQHKSWFPVYLAQMFKANGRNMITGKIEEGTVITGLNFFYGLVYNLKNPITYIKEFGSDNDYQRGNIKRLASQIAVIYGLYFLLSLLIGGEGDDDDDDAFMADFIKMIGLKTYMETKSASPLGIYQEAKSVLKNPIASLTTIEGYEKTFKALSNVNNEDYLENVWNRFKKATLLKRHTHLSDIDAYAQQIVYFNKDENTELYELYYPN